MREIKISLETATRWYNGTDTELKELAIQTYPELIKKELPKTWGELRKINGYFIFDNCIIDSSIDCETMYKNKNIFFNEEQAEASIAMAQLSQLISVYNDGWEPNWNDDNFKYIIRFVGNEINMSNEKNTRHFITLKTYKLREEFLKNFKDLILTAKPLL